MLNVYSDRVAGSVSQQTSDCLKETCPLDGPGVRGGWAATRAGLGCLVSVCDGEDSHITLQQSSSIRDETCPYEGSGAAVWGVRLCESRKLDCPLMNHQGG